MIKIIECTALVCALVLLSCSPPEKSPSGFRLPDGDVERGRRAFVELKCNACHRVNGLDLPPPVADPPVPVVLGGTTGTFRTDGDLTSSIINPSHKVPSTYSEELVRSGEGSRMADYGDVMTVRQLVDLVAFLHSRYEYVPPSAVH